MTTAKGTLHRSRFVDADEELRKRDDIIEGYQDLPLVTLEEAVEPILQFCPDVRRRAHIAMTNSDAFEDGLSQNESAAIRLYTMEWSPRDQCVYGALNSVLRSRDRNRIIPPWFLFLKLLLTAFFKINSSSMTVYRGVRLDFRKKYEVGKTCTWWSFSSCTKSVKVLESELFLGNEGPRTMFHIECFNGKRIRDYSSHPEEDEVLILPGSQFIIESISQFSQKDPDLVTIQMKQVEPRYPLLEDPSLGMTAPKGGTSKSQISKKHAPPKYEEFAPVGTYEKLRCKGRACARCGRCRDWCFMRDRATWEWIRNYMNWNDYDWAAYARDRIWEDVKLREDASCDYTDRFHLLSVVCLCKDNIESVL